MSEREEARLGAMALFEKAKENEYKGEWAHVAVAASLLDISAALWELKDVLVWAFDRTGPGREEE